MSKTAKIHVTVNEEIKYFKIEYCLTESFNFSNYLGMRKILSEFFKPSEYPAIIECQNKTCNKTTSCMIESSESIDILSTWILRHLHTGGKPYEVERIECIGNSPISLDSTTSSTIQSSTSTLGSAEQTLFNLDI